LLKKGDLYFYQNYCQEKTSRFWKPCKAMSRQARQPTANKTEATKQSKPKLLQTKPKHKLKILKPISATRQNQPEIMPTKKTPPNEKAENLKTCLLKKY